MRAFPFGFSGYQQPYESKDVEVNGWYSSTVLLICLPVFFTLVGYTAILFVEVAMKKDMIAGRPSSIETVDKKYKTEEPNAAAGTGPSPVPPILNPNPGLNPTGTLGGTDVPANPTPPTVLPTNVTYESERTVEPYVWEELLVYLIFHLVALTFCIHPAKVKTNQNTLSIILAWIHFVAIGAYAAITVQLYFIVDPETQQHKGQNILSCTSAHHQLDPHHQWTSLINKL